MTLPKTYRCAVIDDEPLALELMEDYVLKTPFLELSYSSHSPQEALKQLVQNPLDLIFLDIEMHGLSGLELSKHLGHSKVIFTTAYPQYAIEGYKVQAFDYLLKPISYADFLDSVQRFTQSVSPASDHIVSPLQEETPQTDIVLIKSENRIYQFHWNEILFFKSFGDYIEVHLINRPKPVLSINSLKILEKKLKNQPFLRVHKSFMVNLKHVHTYDAHSLTIGKQTIPLGSNYKASLAEYFSDKVL